MKVEQNAQFPEASVSGAPPESPENAEVRVEMSVWAELAFLYRVRSGSEESGESNEDNRDQQRKRSWVRRLVHFVWPWFAAVLAVAAYKQWQPWLRANPAALVSCVLIGSISFVLYARYSLALMYRDQVIRLERRRLRFVTDLKASSKTQQVNEIESNRNQWRGILYAWPRLDRALLVAFAGQRITSYLFAGSTAIALVVFWLLSEFVVADQLVVWSFLLAAASFAFAYADLLQLRRIARGAVNGLHCAQCGYPLKDDSTDWMDEAEMSSIERCSECGLRFPLIGPPTVKNDCS